MPKLPSDIYVGEDIACFIVATDPTDGDQQIVDLDCEVQFYTPGRAPKTDPDDRANPEHTQALTYDDERLGYFGLVSTAGWADGTWSYRIVFTGTRTNWSFGTVKVKP